MLRTSPALASALLGGLLLVALAGCVTAPQPPPQRMVGESAVFIGEEPAALAFHPLAEKAFTVRSTYQPGTNTVEYVAGRDYSVDFAAGTLRRLPGSRLPDFRTNLLFGQEEFDHSKFPGFGNNGFFAFIDYTFAATNAWPPPAPMTTALLPKSAAKLRTGGDFRLVAFGDSITAGGDATRPGLIFWNRWADALRAEHPQVRLTAINGATGGDTTVQGLARLQAKVLDQHPDLVLIGFGMNDHNKGSVPVPQFAANLKELIARIRASTGAEIVLFSAFPPNPKWKYGSHHMEDYAAATEQVARETGCAFADVFHPWQTFASRKKPEDLLANDINHPNDFGHWIYFEALSGLGL
ncbi:MAG TPA: SGNH/GDSL hydrolase family protein [Candidatus Limnocylindria bacterium]|nr:SGNH/GDSL hydrolase family protein [Candidatus Limnocylindria bacterium]